MEERVRKNKIIFTKSDFSCDEELFKAVSKQIELLIRSDCICVVYDDDPKGGYIVIEYNKLNDHEPIALPSWIYPDEEALLTGYQDDKELNRSRKKVRELELKKSTIDKAMSLLNGNKDINDDDVYEDEDNTFNNEDLKNGGKGGNKA